MRLIEGMIDSRHFIDVYNDIKKYDSISKVAKELCISERTVRRWAVKLRADGNALIIRSKPDIPIKYDHLKVAEYRQPIDRNSRNDRVLIISDMHAPFQHRDALDFLDAVNKKYSPDRIVNVGDEIDAHAINYHEHDPNLYSPYDELRRARAVMRDLESIFPNMDLVDSNHGSMYYRRAKTAGIPKEAIVSYNDLLGVGSGWRWQNDLIIDLPNGEQVYIHHGKSDAEKCSKNMAMNVVFGHYHTSFAINYWANPFRTFWAMNTGCLINNSELAFAYNKNTIEFPMIGIGMIIDSKPLLIEMVRDKQNRWVGKL